MFHTEVGMKYSANAPLTLVFSNEVSLRGAWTKSFSK